jgi:dCMP deaminase
MNKLDRYDAMYMEVAICISQMSHDTDTKVGSVVVKDNNILAFGFNGMPRGMPNECKHADGSTKPEVIHAEANAVCKLARTSSSAEGATLYCTLAPCVECAKLIIQCGISRVVYQANHKNDRKILTLLQFSNIKVDKI